MTYQKSFPGVEIWKVVAWIVDIYQSIHRGWVKTTGKVFGCRPSEEHIHEAEG